MNLRINGKDETIDGKINIASLVKNKGLQPERIVVERNLNIIPRESWDDVFINDGDAIEIVSFVGGG
jgi:thiamine biosynthesis protein ThiS